MVNEFALRCHLRVKTPQYSRLLYKRFVLLAASLLLFTLPFSSCKRRPLEVVSDLLYIKLYNDYTMPYRQTKATPYHYAVMMYNHDGGKLRYEDFCAEKGGMIQNIQGRYTTLVYDLDNSVTLFDGRDNLSTIRAYTEDESFAVKTTFSSCKSALRERALADGIVLPEELTKSAATVAGEKVIREPNPVYGGANPDVNVLFLGTSDEVQVIPVETEYLLSQGKLTVRGVKDAANISSVQVFITNLAKSKYIATGIPEEEPVAIPFQMDEITEERISGVFHYFGKIDGLTNLAYMVITDNGGGKYLFVFDVTAQIEEQADNANLFVDLDFSVPSPGKGGSGFMPVIDDWDAVWYDVPIGK